MFLDESGDDDYLKSDGTLNQGCTKNITVGGIIVKDINTSKFNRDYDILVQHYFSGIELKESFKLHYTTLKQGKKSPYKEIHFEGRASLSRDVFDTIKKNNCEFIACNIFKPKQWEKYNSNTRNPKAYALLVCIEKFIEFLHERKDTGVIIYEEFEHIRKQMGDEIKELLSYPNFPNIHNLKDIETVISSGNPKQFPILQFADFIAHAIFFHNERPNQIRDIFCDLERRIYKYKSI